MDKRNTFFESQAEEEKLEDYFDFQAWIPLSQEHPRNDRRVFVRMPSGRVEMGSWDNRVGIWKYSPFHVRGTPTSWAGLPLAHETR
jgi:hypothetical protein